MTRSTLSLPDGLSRALAALGAVVALAGVAPAAPITDLTASSPAAGNAEHPDFAAACGTANPYLIAVCYPALLTGSPDDDWIALTVFRDTPNNRPHIDIAHGTQIGAVYGLAYSAVEDAVYVGAFHKRALRFGPGGPGAIYRVGLEDGRITVFATVPNAGEDLHGVLPGPDFAARDLAGKASLGDIDLSPDSSELYAVNLFDRRVYRYEAATGKLLGSFPHGAADEPWAPDARPFGLKALDGHVYHGVVNAAQSSQETGELAGYVYESLPDGSGMRLATQIPLDYARGVARIPGLAGSPEIQELPLEWLPWKDGFNTVAPARQLLYPQPQLADIEFDHHGDMVLGFRDRISEMTLSHEITEPEQPGLGLGDILIATKSGDEWTARYDPEPYYDRTSYADESVIGSLAHLPFDDVTVATSLVLVGVPFSYLAPDYGTDWFRYDRAVGVGNRVAHEAVCNVPREYSALTAPLWTTSLGRGLEDLTRDVVVAPPPYRLESPDDDEWTPAQVLGDVEVLCGPRIPTATATPGPSPTATASPTPSPTQTATATPQPKPIYLPVLIYPCDPWSEHTDVVLVIDASSSMSEDTAAGRPKIEAAREAVAGFLRQLRLPGDQVALVAFNETADLLQPLTDDLTALQDALWAIELRQFTRIDLGIERAREELQSTRHQPLNASAIIVLTDGRNNPEPVDTAVRRAAEAKTAGIRVFAIGLGTEIQETELRLMASHPEDYFGAPDGEDLAEIYRRIAGVVGCPPGSTWPEDPPAVDSSLEHSR